ncbi:hypothetical protein [Massilia sp. METH4]|uniref:hypothetical protein n=1 Tax=Massilia sp. METH4 TaxID=3123041 RepID=UPI0030D20C36
MLIGMSATVTTSGTVAATASSNWSDFEPASSGCDFPAIGTDTGYWTFDETDAACFDFGMPPTLQPEARTMLVPESGSDPKTQG